MLLTTIQFLVYLLEALLEEKKNWPADDHGCQKDLKKFKALFIFVRWP